MPPLLRRCGRASNCGGAHPTSPNERNARRSPSRARAEGVDDVLFGKPLLALGWGGLRGTPVGSAPCGSSTRGGAEGDKPPNVIPILLVISEEMTEYTFGPALRTPNVKNLGTDLAPERLRTCPWLGVHHRYRMTRDTL